MTRVAEETESRQITVWANSADCEQPQLKVYSIALDTGATHMLCWDDQDRYLTEKIPANASVVGAQHKSKFAALSGRTPLLVLYLD